MKKILYIILVIFLVYPVCADETSDALSSFRHLSPEQQIQKLLEDYGYSVEPKYGPSPSRYEQYKTILTENPKAIKPLLIEYLKSFYPPLDNSYPMDESFMVIDSIIHDRFLSLFNRKEKTVS
jgi:hypothetical protein